MTNNLYTEYSAFTATTAQYPQEQACAYLSLGLVEETYEIAEASDPNTRFYEIGDAQWYVCRLGSELSISFYDLVSRAKKSYDIDERTIVSSRGAAACLQTVAAKIAGKVKKFIRDGGTWEACRRAMFKLEIEELLTTYVRYTLYLLDDLWHISARFSSYNDVLRTNMEKLRSRLERGTIRGSGNDR